MPGWTLIVAVGVAFVAAIAVNTLVQIRSTRRGDGLLKMWLKGGLAGGATMLAIVAIFLLVANVINVVTSGS